MRTGRWPALILVAAAALGGAPRAEVVHSSAGGFTLRHTASIARPAGEVFKALLEVESWWHPDHTFSGAAGNLSLEARAGGCFCEKLDDGGSVRHMAVAHVDRGRLLRLVGGLGPLQELAVSGSMTFALEEGEGEGAGTTKLILTYRVGGYRPEGLESWAVPVDGVLATQVARLARFAAGGSPE